MSYVMSNGFAEDVANSDLAIDVLEYLKENGSDYPTNIARELNKSASAINRVLGVLLDNNLVKKSERSQSQYYDLAIDKKKANKIVHRKRKIEERRNEIIDIIRGVNSEEPRVS